MNDNKIKDSLVKINNVKSRYNEAKDLKLSLRLENVVINQEETCEKDESHEGDEIDSEYNEGNDTKDISRRRIAVNICLMIINAFQPYMPTKDNRFTMSYQLPLFIVCSDLRYTSHTNASSLFQILSSSPNPLIVFGYDNYTLGLEEVAIRNKDAVFHSIFDMKYITDICKSYKLEFAQYVTLLPGLKTARILGTKLIPIQSNLNDQKNVKKGISRYPMVLEESQKTKEFLREEIKILEVEVKKQSEDIRRHLKENKIEFYSDEVKRLKLTWDQNASIAEKKKLYDSINNTKIKRDSSFIGREQQRSQLKTKKQELHFKRLVLRIDNKQHNITSTDEDIDQKHTITKEGIGVRKAEDCRIDSSIDIADTFSFSGTDNGVKTITTSVGLSYQRFLFHLDLYNQHNSPNEPTAPTIPEEKRVLNQKEKGLLKLKVEKVNAEDIKIASGISKIKDSLKRSKKN
ncbi:hypothetical protein INT48_009092 [Thamnidium elegans]|uniref:Uncharacterized protein n=1 Tax=Thamnidium elegans TaxID=101142 RepID=A0A8H7SPP5_9FUNG|nr:hypothetical protein INT48_009092 [Thamnidium elegans]